MFFSSVFYHIFSTYFRFVHCVYFSVLFFFFSRGEWSGATTCKLYDGEKKDKGNDLLSLSVV